MPLVRATAWNSGRRVSRKTVPYSPTPPASWFKHPNDASPTDLDHAFPLLGGVSLRRHSSQGRLLDEGWRVVMRERGKGKSHDQRVVALREAALAQDQGRGSHCRPYLPITHRAAASSPKSFQRSL